MTAEAARRVAHRLFRRIQGGRLEITENGVTTGFGPDAAPLRAHVEVRDRRAWAGLLHGSAGLGEGYVEGWWHTDDLVGLTRLAARNMSGLDRVRRRLRPLILPAQQIARLVPKNTRAGARRHISAHYDLGNELFAAFLDERLIYSCAYFPEPGATLEQAQLVKLERICEHLELAPSDHLLEIGTGWGGLAIHAAGEYGCRVTTTTISREQHEFARGRVRELGLADRVEVIDRDYRDLDGTYDKLVSIEMIEAVGWQYFGTFFERCSELIAPDGLMFLQAILIDDRAYESEKRARSFANTHIFPGGCLPSQRLIAEMIANRTDMRMTWAEDISPHYAETLRNWRERFEAAFSRLRPRGYDERFRRLWNFYLAFCEGGFRERRIRDAQMVFAKPAYRGDALAPATPKHEAAHA
jgi:cyclopropane-fatty-acyl-phospholipid synthase